VGVHKKRQSVQIVLSDADTLYSGVDTLYHITPTANLDTIKKEGLKTGSNGCVYCAPDAETVKNIAMDMLYRDFHPDRPTFDWTVVEIDPAKLGGVDADLDPDTYAIAFMLKGDIPSGAIKGFGERIDLKPEEMPLVHNHLIKLRRKRVEKTLAEVEGGWHSQDNEAGVLIDAQTGKIIEEGKGTIDEVLFSDEAEEKMLGNILTHYHPEPSSFSVSDVCYAIGQGLREIRMVDDENIHSIRFVGKQLSEKKRRNAKIVLFREAFVAFDLGVLGEDEPISTEEGKKIWPEVLRKAKARYSCISRKK
jgi:hypothetical protein